MGRNWIPVYTGMTESMINALMVVIEAGYEQYKKLLYFGSY